jgi:hypothetical protein
LAEGRQGGGRQLDPRTVPGDRLDLGEGQVGVAEGAWAELDRRRHGLLRE